MQSGQQPEHGSATTSTAVPPNPFDKHWHVHIDGKTYGPYTGHHIRHLVERHKIVGTDLVYGEGESGSKWLQVANDPILGALFNSSKPPQSPLLPRVETPTRFRKWLLAIPVVALAGWMAWPYYAVYDLVVAVREGDISALENRVAWDTVRQGLRGDLNAVILQKLRADAKSETSSGGVLGAGFAMMLGPAIVDRLVDGYVTPQAIAAANRSKKADNASIDAEAAPANFSETIQAARRVRWDQIKYAFFSGGLLTFRVEFVPDHDPPFKHPIGFRFQWDGSWRLTRMVLPSDAMDGLSAASKDQDGIGSPVASHQPANQSTTKPTPVVPLPLKVALVSKSFKEKNIRANDYQDEITIQIAITNTLDKDVRAFDGVLTFTDLLDNEVLSSKIAINEPLKAGSVLNWSGSINYNQFIDRHQRLRNERQENLKVKFATRKVLFADGSSKDY